MAVFGLAQVLALSSIDADLIPSTAPLPASSVATFSNLPVSTTQNRISLQSLKFRGHPPSTPPYAGYTMTVQTSTSAGVVMAFNIQAVDKRTDASGGVPWAAGWRAAVQTAINGRIQTGTGIVNAIVIGEVNGATVVTFNSAAITEIKFEISEAPGDVNSILMESLGWTPEARPGSVQWINSFVAPQAPRAMSRCYTYSDVYIQVVTQPRGAQPGVYTPTIVASFSAPMDELVSGCTYEPQFPQSSGIYTQCPLTRLVIRVTDRYGRPFVTPPGFGTLPYYLPHWTLKLVITPVA